MEIPDGYPKGAYEKGAVTMRLEWYIPTPQCQDFTKALVAIRVHNGHLQGSLYLMDGKGTLPYYTAMPRYTNPSEAIKWAFCAAETFGGPHMNTVDEAWLKQRWKEIQE